MKIEWIPKEYSKEKIIYNPMDDPLMKKKRELQVTRLNHNLLRIKITLAAVAVIGLILIYFATKVNEMDIALMVLMTMILVMTGIFSGVVPSKVRYKIEQGEQLLLESGILYHRYYGSNDIPNPLYIAYKTIESISMESLPKSHKKLIRLYLDDKTPYKKEIDAKSATIILEENVPDIDLFYDLLKEQVERAKQKVESKESK